MSILNRLKAFVIPPWVRIAWKLLPWTIAALALLGLAATRGTLREDRLTHKLEATQSERDGARQETKWANGVIAGQSAYLETLSNLSKVKDKSDEQTKAYAATPAGAAACLSVDRVREVLAHRAALEAASTPEGGDGKVSDGGTP